MNDIEIQIHAITQQAFKELKEKSPNEDFDLIVRDFSPAMCIQLQKTKSSD